MSNCEAINAKKSIGRRKLADARERIIMVTASVQLPDIPCKTIETTPATHTTNTIDKEVVWKAHMTLRPDLQ